MVERGQPQVLNGQRALLRRGLWIGAGVMVVVFVAIAAISQARALPDDFTWDFSPGWLLLGTAFLIAVPIIHAELWRQILRGLGAPLDRRRGWVIFNLGMVARYVPTQVMFLVVRLSMLERQGVPARVTIASTVYEVALQAMAAATVGVLGFLALPALQDEPLRWLAMLVPIAGAAAVHPAVFSRGAAFLGRRFGAADALPALGMRTLASLFLAMTASFVVAGLGVLCFARALAEFGLADAPVVVSAWAMGYAVSLVAFFVPGGIGVRDGAVTAVLATAMPTGTALAAAVAIRLAQTGIELLLGAVSLAYARRFPELDVPTSNSRPPT